MRALLSLLIFVCFQSASAEEKVKLFQHKMHVGSIEAQWALSLLHNSEIVAENAINEAVLRTVSYELASLKLSANGEMGHVSVASKVISVNKKFTTILIGQSSFIMGDAHPVTSNAYYTYNSVTGEVSDVAKETMAEMLKMPTVPEMPEKPVEPIKPDPKDALAVAMYLADMNAYREAKGIYELSLLLRKRSQELQQTADAYRSEREKVISDALVKVLANKETLKDSVIGDMYPDCFEHGTVAESIALLSPSVVGVAENNQVIIQLNPPYSMNHCLMGFKVPYSDVRTLISPSDQWARWLN